jgi:predicted dehydrogenase
MMTIKRYAIVGTGGRATFYYNAILDRFKSSSILVAFCDTNQTRMNVANERVKSFGLEALPTFKATEFDRMIEETKPDFVIVTTIDRTHNIYIVRAMELGCDVISEKPMTIDEVRCQEILDAVKRTGRSLRVTFNYRYAPHNTRIRELISEGTIGKVHSVHFEWLLNIKHGADYFRRWHRDKKNSGGCKCPSLFQPVSRFKKFRQKILMLTLSSACTQINSSFRPHEFLARHSARNCFRFWRLEVLRAGECRKTRRNEILFTS